MPKVSEVSVVSREVGRAAFLTPVSFLSCFTPQTKTRNEVMQKSQGPDRFPTMRGPLKGKNAMVLLKEVKPLAKSVREGVY